MSCFHVALLTALFLSGTGTSHRLLHSQDLQLNNISLMIKSPGPNQVCCLQLQDLVLDSMSTSISFYNVLAFIDLHIYFEASALLKWGFGVNAWWLICKNSSFRSCHNIATQYTTTLGKLTHGLFLHFMPIFCSVTWKQLVISHAVLKKVICIEICLILRVRRGVKKHLKYYYTHTLSFSNVYI